MKQRKKRQLEGIVVSDKMQKTIVVKVTRLKPHPLYKKRIRRSKKFMTHDERNEARIGDRVIIEECRPLSRHKRWRLVKIIERGFQEINDFEKSEGEVNKNEVEVNENGKAQ